MIDKDFLQWIYNRLKSVHGENPNFDYMHKLKSIIEATDPDKVTPNVSTVIPIVTEDKRFPVLPAGRPDAAPRNIRWSALSEDQAMLNHNQSLTVLADRWGMCTHEIMANVGGYSIFSDEYRASRLLSDAEIIAFLEGIQ